MARKKKTGAQLDADIERALAKKPLAKRALAKGFEPETEEGGRAMMQSITMADITALKPRGAVIPVGTPVAVTVRMIGGDYKTSGVVSWDDGRGRVSVTLANGRSEDCKKAADGSLFYYQ